MPTEPNRNTPANLHDVARLANVSLATASRVLNGSTRVVAADYRERVENAATELGYVPNQSAQTVARGTSAMVALIVSDIADPYFALISAGVTRAAEAAGLAVIISVTGRDPEREASLVRILSGQRPRALILASSRFDDLISESVLRRELDLFSKTGGSVAIIGRNEFGYATATIDNRGAAAMLAESMVERGYREAAVIAGPAAVRTSSDRVDGFCEAFLRAGGRKPRLFRDTFDRDGGYRAAQEFLRHDTDKTQIVFAVSDVMALGVVTALRDAGLIPGVEMAVCGFDDIPPSRDITPALTTVHIPLETLGERALGVALSGREQPPVETAVVIRDSTPRRD